MIAYRILPGPSAGTVRVERADGTLISPCMSATHAAKLYPAPAPQKAPTMSKPKKSSDISAAQFRAELRKLIAAAEQKDAGRERMLARATLLSAWSVESERKAMAALDDASLAREFVALIKRRQELNAKMGLPTPGEKSEPLSAARAIEIARGGHQDQLDDL